MLYMRLMDEQYLKTPIYGVRRMHDFLRKQGYLVNIKRVRRLLRLMGLEAIYPKPRLSQPSKEHKIYPYLLRALDIHRANQVWCADITYIPMTHGFMYLIAIMDWFSRYVLAWEISNSMETYFCLEALERALSSEKPLIFNTDQGSQFTSERFTQKLLTSEVQISMDGRGRVFDNIFIERLWRTLKYEYVYLHSPDDGLALWRGLTNYFQFYNFERSHQSLGYRTPAEVYNS